MTIHKSTGFNCQNVDYENGCRIHSPLYYVSFRFVSIKCIVYASIHHMISIFRMCDVCVVDLRLWRHLADSRFDWIRNVNPFRGLFWRLWWHTMQQTRHAICLCVCVNNPQWWMVLDFLDFSFARFPLLSNMKRKLNFYPKVLSVYFYGSSMCVEDVWDHLHLFLSMIWIFFVSSCSWNIQVDLGFLA